MEHLDVIGPGLKVREELMKARTWNYPHCLEKHTTMAAREQRMLLGLDLARHHAQRGVEMSRDEIASWCGVTVQYIRLLETSALCKLKKRIEDRKLELN